MPRYVPVAALPALTALAAAPAFAHGFAGAHMFVSTLLIDDPNVADEASLPTFSLLPQPANGAPVSTLNGLDFEFDKRITRNFGFALGDSYQWLRTPGEKTANGWGNLEAALKYKAYVNAPHEFMLSLGVSRAFARTGATGSNGEALGNEGVGSTALTLYFGKGFGDIPVSWLRPLAITGVLDYRFADTRLRVAGIDSGTGEPVLNNGSPNLWEGGLTLQYSLRYLQTQVQDLGLPEFANRLTPLVEVAWSSPASRPNQESTQYLFGVGLNYTAQRYGIGVEALIPGNRQSGSHIGVIAQLHLYFDDLLPNTLGKPMVEWWQ